MLPVQKHYVLDENHRPVAIQIAIEDFERIEELIEDFGLAQLMEESEESDRLSKSEALEYYRSLKVSQAETNHVES
jgi:hypothetical protein